MNHFGCFPFKRQVMTKAVKNVWHNSEYIVWRIVWVKRKMWLTIPMQDLCSRILLSEDACKSGLSKMCVTREPSQLQATWSLLVFYFKLFYSSQQTKSVYAKLVHSIFDEGSLNNPFKKIINKSDGLVKYWTKFLYPKTIKRNPQPKVQTNSIISFK